MQLQDIGKILGLQEVEVESSVLISDESGEAKELEVQLKPENAIQICPICGSSQTVLNGSDGGRRVRHLKMGVVPCMLAIPRIRLLCKACHSTFGYEYQFVDGKEQYTIAVKAQVYEIAIGSTVQHSAAVPGIPCSTSERFFKEAALIIAERTGEAALNRARESKKLIIGIDDFSIRKGHNYNTGIHDLRGESMLGIAKGRTLEELDRCMHKNPSIKALDPFAIVMDLAKSCHSFAEKYFPSAIRVADRFHVNHYALEILDNIRKRVGPDMPLQARRHLKRKNKLLRKRNDGLSGSQLDELELLLSYSGDLKASYWLKEKLRVKDVHCASRCYHQLSSLPFYKWCCRGAQRQN